MRKFMVWCLIGLSFDQAVGATTLAERILRLRSGGHCAYYLDTDVRTPTAGQTELLHSLIDEGELLRSPDGDHYTLIVQRAPAEYADLLVAMQELGKGSPVKKSGWASLDIKLLFVNLGALITGLFAYNYYFAQLCQNLEKKVFPNIIQTSIVVGAWFLGTLFAMHNFPLDTQNDRNPAGYAPNFRKIERALGKLAAQVGQGEGEGLRLAILIIKGWPSPGPIEESFPGYTPANKQKFLRQINVPGE